MKNKLRTDIIELVGESLQDEKLTQTELSKRMGTKQASISRFLGGKTNVTLDWAERLIDSMGYKIDIRLIRKEDIDDWYEYL